jgi:hypothetical protein
MGFTDDCFTDGRDPSVNPSVLFSPTEFIAITDGINSSVKLDNVVVINYILKIYQTNCLTNIVDKIN